MRIFRPKIKEERRRWRKLLNVAKNITGMIHTHTILTGSLEGKYNLAKLVVDGRIVLECTLNKLGVMTGFNGLRMGSSGGLSR